MSTSQTADGLQLPLNVFESVSSTIPADRHYFIPDDHGFYCRACSLPRANKRHVERAA